LRAQWLFDMLVAENGIAFFQYFYMPLHTGGAPRYETP
jgi:hypothetical protein